MVDTSACISQAVENVSRVDVVKQDAADIANSYSSCTEHGAKVEAQRSFTHGFFGNAMRKVIDIQSDADYSQLMHEEVHSNGGARVLHAFQDDLEQLEPSQRDRFAELFLNKVYGEVDGRAPYVIGIVHGACAYLPELLNYLNEQHPGLGVQVARMTSRNETTATTMADYFRSVRDTYARGTFRSGPLLQTSLVGKVSEENGTYSEALLDLFEKNPFLRRVLPWGTYSALHDTLCDDRSHSDDGPIFWVRPGEQYLPTDFCEYQFGSLVDSAKQNNTPAEGAANDTKRRKKRNELDSLKSFYFTAKKERREVLFEDRTRAHADHVDFGIDRRTTAAVGLLKAVHFGEPNTLAHDRIVKDVVAFDARDFEKLVSELQLDLHEPPATQCIGWLDEAKLNSLARERGVRFAHMRLHHDDLYFIPRRVVHQFRTVSAVTSVAWHVRLAMYHDTQHPDGVSASAGSGTSHDAPEPPAAKRSRTKKAVLYS